MDGSVVVSDSLGGMGNAIRGQGKLSQRSLVSVIFSGHGTRHIDDEEGRVWKERRDE